MYIAQHIGRHHPLEENGTHQRGKEGAATAGTGRRGREREDSTSALGCTYRSEGLWAQCVHNNIEDNALKSVCPGRGSLMGASRGYVVVVCGMDVL